MRTLSSKGAVAAREHLVESHLPLVRSIARRYAGRGESLEDLAQVGAIGLVKAGNRFDESRGVAFASFAAPVIEGEIRHYLRDKSSVMRIPRDLQRTSGELRRRRGELAAAIGRSPTIAELAAALHIDEEQVEGALRAELAREAVPLSSDAESGRPMTPISTAAARTGLRSPDACACSTSASASSSFLRFFADMTERQIGRELGVSQAQVSRLLSGALAQLRAELARASNDASVADNTMKSATSPASSSDPTPKHARKGAGGRTGKRQPAAKIGDVPASPEDVEHYLDLPYTVAVQSEGEDPRWNATVEELPGCSSAGGTPDEAVKLLRGAMESWLSAALAQGREIPLPGDRTGKQRAASSHSGRFLVRMPGALHAQLASAAEREHLSLNRFVVKGLEASLSSAAADQPSPGERSLTRR